MARHRTAAEKVELGTQARAMRSAGRSRREIAAELHVGDDLLTELLQGTEVPTSLRRRKAKGDHRAAALLLREQGRTYDEIAAELGVSKGSLSLWLSALPHPTEEQRAQVHASQCAQPTQLALLDAPASGDRVVLARQMRLDGLLLREIAEHFSVSVKTACLWCAGLPAPPRTKPGGHREHARMMSRKRWDAVLEQRQRERDALKGTAAHSVGPLDGRDLELLAVVAYWCEGTKDKAYDRRERVTFINSDPGLIRLFLAWLRQQGVDDGRLRFSLSIHASADVERATAFWSDVVGVSTDSFSKATIKRHNPRTVRKNVGEAYVGCLVIRVLQGRTLYQHIEGVWQGIMSGVDACSASTAA